MIAHGPAKHRLERATLLNFDMVHLHASTQSTERMPGPRFVDDRALLNCWRVVQFRLNRPCPFSRLEQYNQPAIDFRRRQDTVGTAEPDRFSFRTVMFDV